MAKRAHRTTTASSRQRQNRRQPEHGRPTKRSPSVPTEQKEEGFLFDPYWDEVFAAYFDPTLRTCCLLKY
jgi:hypothetical protein